jgi:hypothetical protein
VGPFERNPAGQIVRGPPEASANFLSTVMNRAKLHRGGSSSAPNCLHHRPDNGIHRGDRECCAHRCLPGLAPRLSDREKAASVGGLFHFASGTASGKGRVIRIDVATAPPFPTMEKQRPRHAEGACRGRLPLGVQGDQNLRAAQHNKRPSTGV